jgi:hypothetical protein
MTDLSMTFKMNLIKSSIKDVAGDKTSAIRMHIYPEKDEVVCDVGLETFSFKATDFVQALNLTNVLMRDRSKDE